MWSMLKGLQLQIVQNEAVAVVGYAEASDQSTKSCPRFSCRQPAWRRSAGAGTLPGLPRSRCPSRLAARSTDDGRLDCCDGGAALSA